MTNLSELFAYLAKPVNPDDSIFLVLRHGESAGQLDQEAYRIFGDDKIPLTPKGSAQAAAAGQIIGQLAMAWGKSGTKIVACTGNRAGHTARDILRKVKPYDPLASLEYDYRLDKQKFGLFDGHFTDADRELHCGEHYHAYMAQLAAQGAFMARPPGGQSMDDVNTQIRPLAHELAVKPKLYVVVTHGSNALCFEDALCNHGPQWILDNVDKRGNCQIRLLSGNGITGYIAQDVCMDPLNWPEPAVHP